MQALAVTLPTYESLQASPHLPGFSNPRYEVVSPVVDGEERREGEGGEEGRRGREEDEDEFDDLPPPYSPGLAGQESGFVEDIVNTVTISTNRPICRRLYIRDIVHVLVTCDLIFFLLVVKSMHKFHILTSNYRTCTCVTAYLHGLHTYMCI